MTWTRQHLSLSGVEYQISRAMTSGAPEAGDLYRTLTPAGFVYVALLPPDAKPITQAEAQQIRALSQRGFLPIRQVEWLGEQPVCVFPKARLTTADQAPRSPAWSLQWVGRKYNTWRKHWIASTPKPAVRFTCGRVASWLWNLVNDWRSCPMSLDRSEVARQEDLRQLALVTA